MLFQAVMKFLLRSKFSPLRKWSIEFVIAFNAFRSNDEFISWLAIMDYTEAVVEVAYFAF
jgi:hypothetical protein